MYYDSRPTFDGRDAEIRMDRIILLDAVTKPRQGDYVVFANGITRRISHVWDWSGCEGVEPDEDISVQTSTGGSWYLGEGYCSFSGSLYRGVPGKSLTLTSEKRPGSAWFFHHDFAGAGCGVDVTLDFRVYTCNLDAPE